MYLSPRKSNALVIVDIQKEYMVDVGSLVISAPKSINIKKILANSAIKLHLTLNELNDVDLTDSVHSAFIELEYPLPVGRIKIPVTWRLE